MLYKHRAKPGLCSRDRQTVEGIRITLIPEHVGIESTAQGLLVKQFTRHLTYLLPKKGCCVSGTFSLTALMFWFYFQHHPESLRKGQWLNSDVFSLSTEHWPEDTARWNISYPNSFSRNFRNFRKILKHKMFMESGDNWDCKGPLERPWSSFPPWPKAGLKALSIREHQPGVFPQTLLLQGPRWHSL